MTEIPVEKMREETRVATPPIDELDHAFKQSLKEAFNSAGGRSLAERDSDAQVNAMDRLMYLGENAVVT